MKFSMYGKSQNIHMRVKAFCIFYVVLEFVIFLPLALHISHCKWPLDGVVLKMVPWSISVVVLELDNIVFEIEVSGLQEVLCYS